MTPWRRLDALAGRAVNRLHGEIVAVQPVIHCDYTGGKPDTDRPGKEIRAVFSLEFTAEDLRGQRLKGEFAGVGRFALGETGLHIMATEYAALGYEIRRGDRITMTARDGRPAYVVSAAHPLGEGDVLLILTRDHS